jgi:hypothetical protein
MCLSDADKRLHPAELSKVDWISHMQSGLKKAGVVYLASKHS